MILGLSSSIFHVVSRDVLHDPVTYIGPELRYRNLFDYAVKLVHNLGNMAFRLIYSTYQGDFSLILLYFACNIQKCIAITLYFN